MATEKEKYLLGSNKAISIRQELRKQRELNEELKLLKEGVTKTTTRKLLELLFYYEGNIERLCEDIGIPTFTFYKWLDENIEAARSFKVIKKYRKMKLMDILYDLAITKKDFKAFKLIIRMMEFDELLDEKKRLAEEIKDMDVKVEFINMVDSIMDEKEKSEDVRVD